jgi:hypothetical protein
VGEQLQIQTIVAPVWLLAVVLGALHSLWMVVLLANAVTLVRIALLNRAVERVGGVRLGEMLRTLQPSLHIAGWAAAVGAVARWGLGALGLPAIVVMGVGCSAMLLTAGFAAWRLRHPLFEEGLRLWRARTASRAAAAPTSTP